MAVHIDMPTQKAGDSWCGFSTLPVLFDDLPPTATLVSCRLYFRNRKQELVYGFKSTVETGFGLITIIDDANWTVNIPSQVIDELIVGIYDYDYETTDSDGIVRTFYYGILDVTRDVSHD